MAFFGRSWASAPVSDRTVGDQSVGDQGVGDQGVGDQTVSEPVYHCSLVSDWQDAQRSGSYTISSRGRTLADEGFVHASYAEQVPGVLQRYYADLTEPLCLLTIDPDRVGAAVVAENLTGGAELFPHIYGPIPVQAVTAVAPLVRGDDGWWWPPAQGD
jgi:uncharacterized protein (DUF952 family)